MKVSSKYTPALYILFLFTLLNIFVLGEIQESNPNFAETENAAKAFRNLLNGDINVIKLENGDELRIRSNDEKHENNQRYDDDDDDDNNNHNNNNNNNNYSFISNYEVETNKTNPLKKEKSNEVKSKITEGKEDFYILDSKSIETIARVFARKNEFHESEIESFEQSLKDIIKSINN
ncbi:hypothetical protein MKS88_000649 [Plasmodium brasilianum]|uniref:Uncharacterized protein n=1 Tax=Plasmodium brasilianum TaxID=5824 RepID=A0ACB9YG91_PLABR|nr:hypothetical protein MKS88_000649 [Plasmodium brasilianum]